MGTSFPSWKDGIKGGEIGKEFAVKVNLFEKKISDVLTLLPRPLSFLIFLKIYLY